MPTVRQARWQVQGKLATSLAERLFVQDKSRLQDELLERRIRARSPSWAIVKQLSAAELEPLLSDQALWEMTITLLAQGHGSR